ncbi:MAG: succinate dehydrogenase cytochrome b subunit [Chitinophagales bacterium]
MSWLTHFLTSSVGKKLLMSLTGLFLCLFLVIHLGGNFTLLGGADMFNEYSEGMANNPLIKVVAYVLYIAILLHTIQGILLYFKNKAARPVKYAVTKSNGANWSSRNMAILGSIIFLFLGFHLSGFWYQFKFGEIPTTATGANNYYEVVYTAFKQAWIVGVYILSQIVLAFHLWHGFASAFQTLGFNHKKYTPIIKTIGFAYSILVPLGFAGIAAFMFLFA